MLRDEQEYREAVERMAAENVRLEQHRARLQKTGFSAEEVNRLLDPVFSFHQQRKEEIENYERVKRGDFPTLENLAGIGQLLVSLRIAQGLSQGELAKRLEVHETQVSRDEHNEYHGVTLARVRRVLKALGVRLETRVVAESLGNAVDKLSCS